MYCLTLADRNSHFHIKNGSYKFLHTHDFWEFMLITSGNYVHKINGLSIPLKKNTLYIIRPQDVHAILAKDEKNCSHFNLSVNCNYLRSVFNLSKIDLYQKLLDAPLSAPPCVRLSTEDTNALLHLSDQILLNEHSARDDLILMMLLRIFLILLDAEFKRGSLPADYGRITSQIISLINDKQNLSLNLKGLIALTGYSFCHVNRVFAQETGIPLSRYFHDEKIKYAKTLLTDTNYTLEMIAEKVGYSSSFAFSSFFKKSTGIAPSYYAKNNRKNYTIVEINNNTQKVLSVDEISQKGLI